MKSVIQFQTLTHVKCNDSKRDHLTICVVEDIRVMMAIENTSQYKGLYHVLGGLISPLDGIGPNDLKISELTQRIETEKYSRSHICFKHYNGRRHNKLLLV